MLFYDMMSLSLNACFFTYADAFFLKSHSIQEKSIMLSQLTLRFPKKLIESLKSRASVEDTSVNALTERLLDGALKSTSPDDAFLPCRPILPGPGRRFTARLSAGKRSAVRR